MYQVCTSRNEVRTQDNCLHTSNNDCLHQLHVSALPTEAIQKKMLRSHICAYNPSLLAIHVGG